MRARAFAFAAVLAVALLAVGAGTAAADAPDCSTVTYAGSGTSASPYEISNVDELQCMGNASNPTLLSDNFVLVNNIDATGTDTWNGGDGFIPVGNSSSSFDGNFDGVGYTVSDLYVDRPSTDDVGLFGIVGSPGTVANVSLRNLSVTADDEAGGLVGTLDGTVTNSSAVGTVDGDDELGGLVGVVNAGATVNDTSASVTVTGDDDLGGLVGDSAAAVIGSNASGDVSGDDNLGGLIGYTTANVTDSNASGNVTGIGSFTKRLGGLVGDVDDSSATVERSYATGDVDGTDDRVGGLVGRTDGDVIGSYALGNVSGDGNYYGGLVGEAAGDVIGSYARGDVVDGDNDAGGLVGETDGDVVNSNATGDLSPDPGNSADDIGGLVGDLGGALRSSWATGNLTDVDSEAGGLVGDNVGGGSVENSYATGNVTGSGDQIGGLLGSHGSDDVRRSYAIGEVNGTGSDSDRVGGLAGYSSGDVIDSYARGNVTTGDENAGGLVGRHAGDVIDANATGDVTAIRDGGADIGGLVGEHGSGTVQSSWASGDITATDTGAGGLIGQNRGGGPVENSYATGNVTGTNQTGGLIGRVESGSGGLTDNYATGDVDASGDYAGGLIGYSRMNVTRSNATGDVTGSAAVGGLVGLINGTDLEDSYATGNVSGTTDVGGLLGNATADAAVNRVYATGDTDGSDAVGGLVGQTFNGSVDRAYAVGEVTGSTDVGGLIGTTVSGSVTDAYWDLNTTGQSSSAGGTPLTTGEMTGDEAPGNMSGLDFTNTWDVRTGEECSESYPFIRNNTQTPPPVPPAFAGGTGSASDPYQVADWCHLDNVRTDPGADYTLANDLTTSERGYADVASASANGGKGLEPLANGSAFTGTFEGQSYEIRDFVVDRGGDSGVGLFDRTDGRVANLSIANATVVGQSSVGALVGSAGSGTIENVSTAGQVNGSGSNVGGLAGSSGATITRSSSSANVSAAGASGEEFGGLVGFNDGTVRKSYATGTVEGPSEIGGLVGDNDGTVEESYATGIVQGNGGVVGGLVGLNNYNVDLKNSYAAAVVTNDGTGSTGGLLGREGSSSTTSGGLYWDTERSGQSTSAVGTGLTSLELLGDPAKTNTNLGFTNTWDIVDNSTYISYPFLRNNTQVPAPGLQKKRLNFTVEIADANASVNAGETVVVNATIENVGTGDGTQTVNFSVNGTVENSTSVTLNAGESTTEQFNYTTSSSDPPAIESTVESDNDTDSATTLVNGIPDASNDSYTTSEDTTLSVTAPGVLANDSDPDGDVLNASKVSGATNGTVTVYANGSIEYDPDPMFNGADSFTYRASDGSASDTATVTINVSAVNDAPTAENDSYATSEDTTLSVTAPGVLANDSDPDGDSLNASKVSGAANGTVTVYANGSIEYDPDANFNGADSFTYEASDGNLTDTAVVNVTVNPVHDAPNATNDSYTTSEDTTLSVGAPGVLGNDSDPDGEDLNASVVAGPTNGTLSLAANGSFTYTPDPDFFGTDSFTYEASDRSASDTATVTVEVTELTADLVVGINTTNAPVLEGETLKVTATVANVGNDTGTRTVKLDEFDDAVVDTETVTLTPGASTTVTLAWANTSEDDGTDTVAVVAGDDDATRNVTVLEPASTALSIVETTSPVLQGGTLVVNASLTNTGDVSTTRNLTLTVGGEGADNRTVTVPGETTRHVGMEWTAPDGVVDNYTATVTSGNLTATTVVHVDCIDKRNLSRDDPEEAACDGQREDGRNDSRDDGRRGDGRNDSEGGGGGNAGRDASGTAETSDSGETPGASETSDGGETPDASETSEGAETTDGDETSGDSEASDGSQESLVEPPATLAVRSRG